MRTGVEPTRSTAVREMITLTVNGKPVELSGEMTLTEFLQVREVDPLTVAAEHNGAVVKRGTFDAVRLRNGDRLEVVRMIGGGARGG